MKNVFKSFTPLELTVLILFVFYLMFNVETPKLIAETIESPIGLLTLMVLILYLFFYANPIVAILFIFVSFELLKRTSYVTGRKAIVDHTPTQDRKNAHMKAMNPVKTKTLEEEMVEKMAPVGKGEMVEIINTGFKPVATSVEGASKV
jgi:hypothetical protein